MTIIEFYDKADGSYNEVINALGKEERIRKYLLKFRNTNMDEVIKNALDAGDYQTAFREAHNLKGMSMNIALDKLRDVSSDLTESLRHGPVGDVDGLYKRAAEEYRRVCLLVDQIDQ